MKNAPFRRVSRLLTCGLLSASVLTNAQAANVTHNLPTVGATNWSTAAWTNGVPNAVGDVAAYTGATAGTTTLDQDVVLGVLKNTGAGGNGSWTIATNGTNFITMDGTGLTAGNNPFGVAGEAAISLSTNATYIINPNIVITNTDLGIGTTGNSPITVAGTLTATTAQTIHIRGGGSGGINLTGAIGQTGSAVGISNANNGTSAVVISGNLGTHVTSVTQNSATSAMSLSGANTYTGTTTLSQGTLTGSTVTQSNTPFSPFGTSALVLNGGTLNLRAPGSVNDSTPETITFGNNVSISADVIINVGQATGFASANNKTIAFNDLTIAGKTVTVSGANSYGVGFLGTTTLTGNVVLNTLSGNLVLGAINDGGNGYGILKHGTSSLTIKGAGTYTGATAQTGGTLAVNGATGTLAGTSAVSVTGNGALQIGDATTGLLNRINTAAALTLGGGTGSGSLTIFRGAVTANNQSFAALNVGKGSNLIQGGGSGGTLPVLTISGGTPYVRSVGGLVNLNDANVTITFTNAASGESNVSNGLLVGAVKQGNDFVLAQSGNVTASAYTANTWATGNKTNVTVTSDLSATPGLTTAALRFNTAGAVAVTLAGINVIESGGILVGSTATSGTISGGSIKTGLSGGDLWVYLNGKPLTINSVIADNNTSGLTLGGGGLLTVTGANTYAGPTTIGAGTLQIGNGGSTGDLGTSSSVLVGTGATLTYNRTGALTLNKVGGGGIVNVNNAAGSLTLSQSGGAYVIRSIGGVTGATIEFAGDGTGETTLGSVTAGSLSYMNVAGMNYKFTSGTVNLLDNARGSTSNVEIAGGTVNVTGNPWSFSGVAGGTQTFTMSSGVVNASGTNGISGFNGVGGAGQSGALNSTFIGKQTGGSIFVTGASGRFDLGSTSATNNTTYTFSGGLISQVAGSGALGMTLGADVNGLSKTTFNFSGGKLLQNTTIKGAQGAGAKQAFVWTGGTLATLSYEATNLTSTAGMAVVLNSTNTLTNAGGILAPGDIGVTGRTGIVGNYAVTNANAGLYIDIGGTTASSIFQNPGLGFHDQLIATANNSNFALGGKLYVDLLDGAGGTGSFTIVHNIRTGGTVTGTFNNTVLDAQSAGQRVVLENGLGSYLVTYNTQSVVLGSYIADNVWAGFDGANWTEASNWAAFAPQAAGHLAKFTTEADGGTVNLDADLTIGGLLFDNTDNSYTISSTSERALTLDNTNQSGSSDSTLAVVNGTHTVAVPIVLANNLAVTTTGTTSGLTLSGSLSGIGKSVTKSGAGSLTLTGANTYTGGTTVSEGSLFVNNTSGSGTGTGALSIAASALLGGSGHIGSVTVIHGTLAPGSTEASAAVLAFENAVTFKDGSAISIDINGTAARGTDYDGIDFNGALTIEGGTLTFNISTAIADNSVLTIFTGTDLTAGFTSVVASGTGTGSVYDGAFTFNSGGNFYTGVFGDQTLTFDLTSGNLSFAGSAIPEPATYVALFGIVALTFVVSGRRRRVV